MGRKSDGDSVVERVATVLSDAGIEDILVLKLNCVFPREC